MTTYRPTVFFGADGSSGDKSAGNGAKNFLAAIWEQDAAGSSPVTSTIFQELKLILSSFFFAKNK